MNNFQIVFKNTTYLTLSEIFLKALGFVWVIFLAHQLSVSLFGRYNFVNSFIGIFSIFADLGVGLIVIREIAKRKEKANLYLGSSLILNGLLSLFTVFIILMSGWLLRYSQNVWVLIAIASFTLFVSTFRSVGIFFFDGIEKMHYSAILNSLNSVLLIAGGFLGFMLGFGLAGIFIGMVAGTLLSLILTWFIILKNFIVPKFVIDVSLIKHLLFEGLPLGLASFFALIYTEIDTVFLNQMLGEKAVGIYSAATPFVFSSIQLLNVPFMVALYPALTRLSMIDSKRFKKAIFKSLGFITLWSVPYAILISSFAHIVPIIFGAEYQASIPVLRLLIFFVPFASFSALLYKVLIIFNKQKIYLLVSLLGSIINIALNLFLIPKFNVIGAAAASVATQIAIFVLYFIIVFKAIYTK